MKINNNKGFTLAEMLIVVAIIGVLVAIAIPTFTGQLERAKETADLSALRSAYAEATSNQLSDPADDDQQVITGVSLSSDGAFDYADAGALPFTLTTTSITKGTHSVTFDFSGSGGKPTASIS